MISVDEALARIRAAVLPRPSIVVPLEQASGRVLAEPVAARLDQPPFAASAMDGYAVRAADVSMGAVLTKIGVSQAGKGFDGLVSQGQCVRIFTGAPVPKGADAVVMQERTEVDGAKVTVLAGVQAGTNIRPQGNDFAQGDILSAAGEVMTPARIALAAAANHATCTIMSPPSLALMATGDELILPGTTIETDQIVASNSFGLTAMFSPYCGDIIDCGIVPDDRARLATEIGSALDRNPDVFVTTGGASVGEHDFVKDVLKENGVDIDFWRIAVRPGKPLMFGRKGATLVFGLPGNPVSAMVTAHVFVLPALRALLGTSEPAPLRLPLGAEIPQNGPRRHFLRAQMRAGPDGMTTVLPIAQTDSGHLSSLAQADCLIVQPEGDMGRIAGEPVEVVVL
ncbi:gephyrin-like molybdotransferase Glp [Pelagibacterium halotolerans]|uniref:molybdopterin molybdotransferase MoeA n=1 Tax=Pelagibacterium halotolerans TaxID=531813 RepID=UPI003850A752